MKIPGLANIGRFTFTLALAAQASGCSDDTPDDGMKSILAIDDHFQESSGWKMSTVPNPLKPPATIKGTVDPALVKEGWKQHGWDWNIESSCAPSWPTPASMSACGFLLTDGSQPNTVASSIESCLTLTKSGAAPCVVTLKPAAWTEMEPKLEHRSLMFTTDQATDLIACKRDITLTAPDGTTSSLFSSDTDLRTSMSNSFYRNSATRRWSMPLTAMPTIRFQLTDACEWRFAFVQLVLVRDLLPLPGHK